MENKWIVNIKGNSLHRDFEISVVRTDNKHGIQSYGWFGEDKVLISSSGGPCRYFVPEFVWDKLVSVAHQVAKELNEAL